MIDEVENGIRISYDGEWIYGFGSNDVWIAGQVQAAYGTPLYPKEVPALIHYNGSKWELQELPVEGKFWYLWGNSSNNLWACGTRGLVGHYDGKNWAIDSIQIAAGNDNFILRSIIEYNNTAYVIGYKMPMLYFCKKESAGNWEVLDSVETTYLGGQYPFGESRLYLTSDNKMISYGTGGVWEYSSVGEWIKLITIEERGGVSGFKEYTPNKFIVSDFQGKIYHYSGGVLDERKDVVGSGFIYNLWANSKECFVVVNKWGSGISSSTVVYHGK